jgi:hypothetical protein
MPLQQRFLLQGSIGESKALKEEIGQYAYWTRLLYLKRIQNRAVAGLLTVHNPEITILHNGVDNLSLV